MIYIMSDIHGQYDKYKKMLEMINFSDKDFLYVLGDVIDRGPDGIEILLDLMDRKNVEVFLGNHEHMMLTYLNGIDRHSWFYSQNGGQVTYHRFESYDKDTRNKILDYLYNKTTLVKTLKFKDREYILSHTGFWLDGDKYTKDYKNNIDFVLDFVWDQYYYRLFDNVEAIKNETGKEITFISGHRIVNKFHDKLEIYEKDFENGYKWIDIDCGCALGEIRGKLACVAIGPRSGKINGVYYV